MPLPDAKAPRTSLHHRSIQIRGYKREDGLYDVEAHLVDIKDFDYKVMAGVRPAGEPLHDMWLRITVDRELNIVDAEAASDAMPYVGFCDEIVPHYRRLIGLSIRPGYQQRVKALFDGVRGCSHITDLANVLASAAFQTLGGQGLQPADRKPFQLDRCHALDSTGRVVARYYPRWYRGTEPDPDASETEQHH